MYTDRFHVLLTAAVLLELDTFAEENKWLNYLSIYLYSSNNKTICNTTIHAIGQDSETEILNTALKNDINTT